jgi:hypothetical protein
MNTEVHIVGYIYYINAWKMDHIKIFSLCCCLIFIYLLLSSEGVGDLISILRIAALMFGD